MFLLTGPCLGKFFEVVFLSPSGDPRGSSVRSSVVSMFRRRSQCKVPLGGLKHISKKISSRNSLGSSLAFP